MYSNKVNGKSFAGEFLGGNLQFYTLTTTVDIKTVQANLDKVVEVISLNGQPVLLGGVGGTGPYTMIFAIEHTNAWATGADLVNALVQHAPVAFAGATTTVTVAETL